MKLDEELYRRLVLLNSAVLLLVLILGVGFVTARRERIATSLSAILQGEKDRSSFLHAIGVSSDTRSALASFPKYELKIEPKHYREIQVLTRQMVRRGALLEDHKRWFPTRVRLGGEEYGAKIRMRGDLPEHWERQKKSWRVKFARERFPDGYRSVDLVIPHDKAYEVEPVAYGMARELGLLVPDAGFAHVTLNGVDMGLYLWIERYGREMLERQRYPAGEIFRERNTWVQTRWTGYGAYREEGTLRLRSSNFSPALGDEPDVGHAARRWHELLELIREADDATFAERIGEYLDLEKYLAWNALTWLFGSVHAHWSDNLRWYYDDTLGRFEPILYDVNRFAIDNRRSGTFEAAEHDPLAKRLLAIPRHQMRRNQILWRLVDDDAFDAALRCEALWSRIRPALVAGVEAKPPEVLDRYHAETVEILRRNRADLRGHLEFARAFATPLLEERKGSDALVLEVVPDSLAPIRLDAVAFDHARPAAAARPTARLVTPQGETVPLAMQAVEEPSGALRLAFSDVLLHTPRDPDLLPYDAVFRIEIEGLEIGSPERAGAAGPGGLSVSLANALDDSEIAGPFLFQAPVLPPPRSTEVAGESPRPGGLPLQRRGDRLVLPRGVHRVLADVTIPAAYALVLEPGAVLELAPGVSIVSRGPVLAEGSEALPIRIRPLDPRRPWGSFAVVGAGRPSVLRHVQVRGGSEDRVDGLHLSGQLAFHSSPVRLSECEIADAHADDGLNVKRASFEIRGCRFVDNAQDGFDGDWVTGTVKSSTFEHNGGDGLDLSGSEVTVVDSLFDGMGDKALSVGERSRLIAFNDVIRDSEIGIAVKDLSRADVSSSVFYGNRTAVSAYRKKPLFGGGTGAIGSSLFWRNDRNVAVDGESTLLLDTVAMETWSPRARVETENVRTGDLAAAYREAPRAAFAFLGGAPQFARGANPRRSLPDSLAVPDLREIPIGLARPLELR